MTWLISYLGKLYNVLLTTRIRNIIQVHSTKSPHWLLPPHKTGVHNRPQAAASSVPLIFPLFRLLRSCKYKLEKDLTDKLKALDIDSGCATLTDTSPRIGYSQGTVKVQTKWVTTVYLYCMLLCAPLKNVPNTHTCNVRLISVYLSVCDSRFRVVNV